MTRAHSWLILAFTVGCSSESSPDGSSNPLSPTATVSPTTTGGQTSTTAGPTGSTTGPATTGPSGPSGPSGPATTAPVTSSTTTTTTTTTSSSTTTTTTSSEPAGSSTSEEPATSSAPAETSEPEATSEDTGGVSPGGDTCVKGSTKGNEVVFIGESFIAASSIPEETTALAIQNGSLQQGDKYLDFSVSGTRMGDGAIPRQYTQAQAQNPIRFVLMNGGGNDCLQANDPNAPIPAAEKLYEEMAKDGVEKVVYFFYPDAAGSFGGPSSQLQTCLNTYRPKIKALCDSLTAPKCYWIDLATTAWKGNEAAYTQPDGIHPNAQGSKVTAEEIWKSMVENCVAQ